MGDMNLSRRGFLRLLGAAAPVAAVAPTYFFAPVGGWRPKGYSTFLVGKDAIVQAHIGQWADYLPYPKAPDGIYEYQKKLQELAFQLIGCGALVEQINIRGFSLNHASIMRLAMPDLPKEGLYRGVQKA